MSSSPQQQARQLDRMAAKRMHVEKHVALTASPVSITLRAKLQAQGIDLDNPSPAVKRMLGLVDDIGTQKMLREASLSVRYAAAKSSQPRQQPAWG